MFRYVHVYIVTGRYVHVYPLQALFNKHSQITGRVKQQQTDIDDARQRVIPGQA